MPDTSPPKWIYTNVTAIRANTERILALLEEQGLTSAGHRAIAAGAGGRARSVTRTRFKLPARVEDTVAVRSS